jgi:hypothetical protein
MRAGPWWAADLPRRKQRPASKYVSKDYAEVVKWYKLAPVQGEVKQAPGFGCLQQNNITIFNNLC